MSFDNQAIVVIASGLFSTFSLLAAIKIFGLKIFGKSIDSAIDNLFVRSKTQIVSEVQKSFNESLEELKASLSKGNISHQLQYSEYVKRQYTRLEELYAQAYVIRKIASREFTLNGVYLANRKELSTKANTELFNYVEKVYMSSFYLDEESRKVMFEYANKFKNLQEIFDIYQNIKDDIDELRERGVISYRGEDEECYRTQKEIEGIELSFEEHILKFNNEKRHFMFDCFASVDIAIKKVFERHSTNTQSNNAL